MASNSWVIAGSLTVQTDLEVKGKATINGTPLQNGADDWNISDSTQPGYILNKPPVTYNTSTSTTVVNGPLQAGNTTVAGLATTGNASVTGTLTTGPLTATGTITTSTITSGGGNKDLVLAVGTSGNSVQIAPAGAPIIYYNLAGFVPASPTLLGTGNNPWSAIYGSTISCGNNANLTLTCPQAGNSVAIAPAGAAPVYYNSAGGLYPATPVPLGGAGSPWNTIYGKGLNITQAPAEIKLDASSAGAQYTCFVGMTGAPRGAYWFVNGADRININANTGGVTVNNTLAVATAGGLSVGGVSVPNSARGVAQCSGNTPVTITFPTSGGNSIFGAPPIINVTSKANDGATPSLFIRAFQVVTCTATSFSVIEPYLSNNSSTINYGTDFFYWTATG